MLRWMKRAFGWISRLKLRYRLFAVYIVGGALPIILLGSFLIQGNARILVKQAENGEAVELEMMKRQVEELTETVNTVSRYFYFDRQLEEISGKRYVDYAEMVVDFREYTSFLTYSSYYSSIRWMCIYMTNPTIRGNSRFVKVTEEMAGEEWYQSAKDAQGKALWRYLPIPSSRDSSVALLRALRTRQGDEVGILAIHLRPERFQSILSDREYDSFILLNGKTELAGTGGELESGQILEFLPDPSGKLTQKNIFLNGMEYVMTCETMKLAESDDYLQLVSLRAYREILSQASRQNMLSMVLFLVSVVLSVTVIRIFSHSYSRRVERFLGQMQKAASGSFELEEKLGGNDEIAELYDYLGTMIYQIQRLLAEVYQERLHAEQLRTRQKDAEFKMLASQINPHFLYNTLETIRMKARRSKQAEIEQLVKMLAKILRSTLQVGGGDVTIRSEIELVEYYLKIQQYRFEERIQYRIEVEESLKDMRILPLIVQPLVENSIIHGLEGKEGVGTIAISVRAIGAEAVIAIEDDGLGIPEERLERMRRTLNIYNEDGRHIGVGNVHQRVKLKYGTEYGVTIDSLEGMYTRVEIHLPLRPKEGAENGVQSYDSGR